MTLVRGKVQSKHQYVSPNRMVVTTTKVYCAKSLQHYFHIMLSQICKFWNQKNNSNFFGSAQEPNLLPKRGVPEFFLSYLNKKVCSQFSFHCIWSSDANNFWKDELWCCCQKSCYHIPLGINIWVDKLLREAELMRNQGKTVTRLGTR